MGVTHTHTGPGGYHHYFLYSMASAGFVKDVFDAQVNGIVEVRAFIFSKLNPEL